MKNEMRLNADRTRLLLNISGDFDTAALEDLVLLLGGARKAMEPPVPSSEQDNGGAQLRCTTEPLSGLAADHLGQDGKQVLRLRSVRFGWLGWEFSELDARALFELLAQRFEPDRHQVAQAPDPKH
jgi:hypothetical protein